MEILITSYIILLILAVAGLGILVKRKVGRRKKRKDSLVSLLVIIPQGVASPLAKHTLSEIELSADLYKRLIEKKIPFVLEAAVHGVGEEVSFYISIPEAAVYETAKLIESLWPHGYATTAEDYSLWISNDRRISTAYLRQGKPYSVPLKENKTSAKEPLQPILKYLSNLDTVGEGVSIQWVVQPAHPKLLQDTGRLIRDVKTGRYDGSKHVHEDFILTPENVKRIENKVASPLVAVNSRIIVSAKTKEGADKILHKIGELYENLPAGSLYNHFKVVVKDKSEVLVDLFLEKKFDEAQEMVLNSLELSTLFHLPGPNTIVPKIRRK